MVELATTGMDGKAGPVAGAKESRLSARSLVAFFVVKAGRAAIFIVVVDFLAYHLVAGFGVEPALVQLFAAVSLASGLFRPFLAAASDRRPVRGMRRKPGAIAGNAFFIGATALLLAAVTAGNAALAAALLVPAFVLHLCGETFIDVAHDSLLIDLAGDDAKAKTAGQVVMRAGASAGALATYLLGSVLVEAGFPLLLLAVLGMFAAATVPNATLEDRRVSRAELDAARARREWRGVPRLALKIGFFVMFTTVPDGLIGVVIEPWMIEKTGTAPGTFFFSFFLAYSASLVAIAAIGKYLSRPAAKGQDYLRVLVPVLAVRAVYYLGLLWFTPNVVAYGFWLAAGSAAGMLGFMIADRIFMDVVKGVIAGTTFQVFAVFISAGSVFGSVAGALLAGTVGVPGLLGMAAGITAVLAVVYKLVVVKWLPGDGAAGTLLVPP